MRRIRPHPKITIWDGGWWAVQWQRSDTLSLGFAFFWRRPLLDIYLSPITIAIGRQAACTDVSQRRRQGCRGFIFPETPVL